MNRTTLLCLSLASLTVACDTGPGIATVSLMNDFNDPAIQGQPPWTICQSSYLGVEFGPMALGATSPSHEVTPGLDYVLMVAAFNDPTCSVEHCLPIATEQEEEVVDGQTRSIQINLPNHQGPCPPEGVAPIPEDQYNRILQLWPSYNFLPYDQRANNPECQ